MRTNLLVGAAMWAIIVLCMCDSKEERHPTIHVEKTRCPLLEKYAQRNDIPPEVLKEQGSEWPQFVKDFSVSHGPNLSREEQREFTRWQVK